MRARCNYVPLVALTAFLAILPLVRSVSGQHTDAPLSASSVHLDQPLHFTAPDGGDAIIPPGMYHVDRSSESGLRLTPGNHDPALEIQAVARNHEETVTSPNALLIAEEGYEDDVHLVLLLPEGQSLEASGTISGTRSRAAEVRPLTRTQVQHAMTQRRPFTQAARPSALKVPPGVAAKLPAKGFQSGPGKFVTWNYLYMNAPEIVAQALADVQAGKRPLASLSGLASPPELTELLKTNWSAEASRLNHTGNTAVQSGGVTTRALPNAPLKGVASVGTGVTPGPPLHKLTPVSLPLAFPPMDLGSHWAGERHDVSYSLTAPFDGTLQCGLNLEATRKRFRIIKAMTYTGQFDRGTPIIDKEVLAGKYEDVRPKSPGDPTLVSMAGTVAIPIRAGQRVMVMVAFEPDAGYGPPVGLHEVTLEFMGTSLTGARWERTLPLRVRSLGINFGILAYAEQGHAETLTNNVVELPIVVTNAAAKPWTGSITAMQLPQGVAMDPVQVSFSGQGMQRHLVRLRVSDAAQDGASQPVVVQVNGSGQSRSVHLSLTIYHPLLFWCTSFAAFANSCGAEVPGSLNPYINMDGWVPAQYVRKLRVWVERTGQWAWQIDLFNGQSDYRDPGGTDFLARFWFLANPNIADVIEGHVGPDTMTQLYTKQGYDGMGWVASNFFTVAQTGFGLRAEEQ